LSLVLDVLLLGLQHRNLVTQLLNLKLVLLVELIGVAHLLLLHRLLLRTVPLLLRILHTCYLIYLLQDHIDRVVGIHLISFFLTHLLRDQGSILLSSVTAFIPRMVTNFRLRLSLLLLDWSCF